jgi:hypothetical protein
VSSTSLYRLGVRVLEAPKKILILNIWWSYEIGIRAYSSVNIRIYSLILIRHLNFQSRLNSSRLCILTQNKIDFGSGELKSFWDPEQQIGKLKNVTEHRRSNEK